MSTATDNGYLSVNGKEKEGDAGLDDGPLMTEEATANEGDADGRAADADEGAGDKAQMKRSINLLHCTAILIAVTGHSSVFISPAPILATSGSIGASLIIWLVGGLINLGLALCFAEMGTMMPHAGGPYAYVSSTFGPLAGFLIMWGYLVLVAGPFWAFQSLLAARYIGRTVYPDCVPERMETGVKLLAGWLLITLVAINCAYMKHVTRFQTAFSVAKMVALFIIIAAGIYKAATGHTENFENLFEGSSREPGQFAVATFYSIFSYGGWQVLLILMEEVKKPARDLPMSTYLTFSLVIAVYILTNLAYYTLLTPAEVLRSEAVALMFFNRLYRPLSIVITILVAATSIGALNAAILGHSRLLFAAARKGHMPTLVGMIHVNYLTPWPAIFVELGISLAMLYSGSLTGMMEFVSFFSTIMSVSVVIVLLWLRWFRPHDTRPYKTPLVVAVLELFVNLTVLVLAIYQKPDRLGVGLAIVAAGVPVYCVGVLWTSKPAFITRKIERFTILAQKTLMLAKTQ